MGARNSHDVLRKVLASREPSKILDAPSGTGILTQFLLDRGWEVHCADIDPGHLKVKGVPFTQVNLNRGISLEDESFDSVLCANGLHRLYNPGGAISEFYRVLRPGGSLYITMNNYAAVDERLRFFFYGSIAKSINESDFDQTISDPEANVRHYLFYPHLANLLESAGFSIVDLRPANKKFRHYALAPLGWAIRLGTYFINPASRRKSRLAETSGPGILPGGKYLFLEARKPESD